MCISNFECNNIWDQNIVLHGLLTWNWTTVCKLSAAVKPVFIFSSLSTDNPVLLPLTFCCYLRRGNIFSNRGGIGKLIWRKKGTLRFNRDLALQERLCILAIVINNMPKLAHKGSKIRLCKYIHDRTPKDYHELTIWSSCIHLVLHHRWPSLSPCKGFMHESS